MSGAAWTITTIQVARFVVSYRAVGPSWESFEAGTEPDFGPTMIRRRDAARQSPAARSTTWPCSGSFPATSALMAAGVQFAQEYPDAKRRPPTDATD